jgi:hypothetical protein
MSQIPHISKMPSTSKDADDMMWVLSRCRFCVHFKQADLFRGFCHCSEYAKPFPVGTHEGCEAFHGKEKKIEHWINRLVQISLDCDGQNDFFRQLNYHEQNGTAEQFLGL